MTALPPLPEPEGWTFQHEDTGRMTTLENDGVNNPENFAKNNPRFYLCESLYSADQLQAYARECVAQRDGEFAALADEWQVAERFATGRESMYFWAGAYADELRELIAELEGTK